MKKQSTKFSRFSKHSVKESSAKDQPVKTVAEINAAANSSQKEGRPWKPSAQQEAIFQAVADGTDNIVVQAGAGCGKTTTTIEAVKPLAGKQKVILLAFNKSIADELQEKVPDGIEARTLHSLGLASLRQTVKSVKIVKEKVEDAIQELFPKDDFEKLPSEDWRSHNGRYYGFVAALRKLVSLTKNYGVRNVDLDFVSDMIGNYGLTIMPNEELTQQVNQLLDNSFNNVNQIDFDDMMWLPIVREMKLPRYDFVGIDESQDLNPLRQQYALRVADRLMVIGDEKQSIYGFCGADVRSMANMTNYLKQRGSTQQLPLNITRRCPKSHVAIANSIFPGALEAAPDAPEGTVAESELSDLFGRLQPKDFVLCRTNAPLLWAAFRMVKAKRPVVLLGRDFGEGLKHLIKSCAADTQAGYFRNLDAWYHDQMTKFDGPSPKLERIRGTIQDKYDSIMAVSEGCNNSSEALNVIDILFSETAKSEAAVFSTVHKAKGLESNRVFIMCPHLMPHPMAREDWAQEQEQNIKYIACTRAKLHLEYVNGDYRKL